jgi:hypothetical protein
MAATRARMSAASAWTQVSRVVLPLKVYSATCAALQAGGPSKLSACYVTLSPGQNPPGDNMTVVADLRPIGGRENAYMLKEMGTDGLGFSLDLRAPADISPGTKTILFKAVDGQGRTATGSATLEVLPPG